MLLRGDTVDRQHLDDVAIAFPDIQIVIAHPSWPWQDEALSVAMHKPNVWIDLSGWSPKYFPPQLVQYANTLLKDRVLFGSDFPHPEGLGDPLEFLDELADLPHPVVEQVMGGNLKELLALDPAGR